MVQGKKTLVVISMMVLILYGVSSMTAVFAINYYGNINYHFTNENNDNSTCGQGGVSIGIQPTVDYNELASTGAAGDYGYQFQISSPNDYLDTTNTIAFQQGISVVDNQIVAMGSQELPYYGGANVPSVPSGINPALTTTNVSLFQMYNSNQVLTGFGWIITYESGGQEVTLPPFMAPVGSDYSNSIPDDFQMNIMGDPGQMGGYGDFFAGQGVMSYYGGSGLSDQSNCVNQLNSTEDSNMAYGSVNCPSSNICAQSYAALPLQLSLTASPSSPTIGQNVQLTATVNLILENASKLTVQIDDLTTNEVIQTCGAGPKTWFIGTQCSVTVQENSATSQEYVAALFGYGGYILASSSHLTVNWGYPSLTVNSENQNLQTITGYYTVLEQNGNQVGTGFTPVTFNALGYDESYTVYVDNYGSCAFSYWADNGNTNRERSFTSTQSFTFTAVYDCSSGGSGSVTVNTVDQNNNPITGYYVGLYNSGGTLISHGFSPITFSGLTIGTGYSVEPDNYGTCSFNHWQDTGSTTRDRSFTAASTQTFVAVYDCT